jgi:hypothetical protein
MKVERPARLEIAAAESGRFNADDRRLHIVFGSLSHREHADPAP